MAANRSYPAYVLDMMPHEDPEASIISDMAVDASKWAIANGAVPAPNLPIDYAITDRLVTERHQKTIGIGALSYTYVTEKTTRWVDFRLVIQAFKDVDPRDRDAVVAFARRSTERVVHALRVIEPPSAQWG